MLRSHVVKVVPIALTLVGCGLAISPAIAQTTYPFKATYNSEITTTPDKLGKLGSLVSLERGGKVTHATLVA